MKRIELVATVGPASERHVRALVEAGATALRLNASHLLPGGLGPALAGLREAAPAAPVVVDLQGAKMRVGRFEARDLAGDEPVVFALEPTTADEVPLPHPELFSALEVGDVLSCDDGRLELSVETVAPDRLLTRTLRAGRLAPRKGINRRDHPLVQTALTPGDAAFVEEAARWPGVSFAYSFMADGREAEWVRARAPGRAVAGKVERREAADAVEALARRVDSIWICRGDLGAQLGSLELARFVAGLDPRAVTCPVLMAGQVLQQLTTAPAATRSEVCHLYDLLHRGYAGVVLSDETAIGVDPVAAVGEAARLVRELA